MPLVGGADPNGTASGDPTDLRSNRPYGAISHFISAARNLLRRGQFTLEEWKAILRRVEQQVLALAKAVSCAAQHLVPFDFHALIVVGW
eukprot:6212359-Pleurochrysis_carterae.AAC.2